MHEKVYSSLLCHMLHTLQSTEKKELRIRLRQSGGRESASNGSDVFPET